MSDETRTAVRQQVIEVAARLLRDHGPGAVTTRGVAEGAGVQAPVIYRLFGNKDGLLEAVAEHVMAGYVAAKSAKVAAEAAAGETDPLDDLWAGWRAQVTFGLANPALFRLLSDPDRVVDSPAARSGREVLAARVARLAATGRLRVSERRAVDLIQAAGTGTIQTLLSTPPEQRDDEFAEAMLAAVLGRILTDAPAPADTGPLPAVVAFAAVVPQLTALDDAERHLLAVWLDRVIESA